MKPHCTSEEAVQAIASGQRVYLHGMAGMPQELVRALVARAPELRNVEIVQLHTEGPAPYADPEVRESFRVAKQRHTSGVGKTIASP